MVPFFHNERMTLSGTLSNYYEYNVMERKNTYNYNAVYSDPMTTDLYWYTSEHIGYIMDPASSTTLPMSEFDD